MMSSSPVLTIKTVEDAVFEDVPGSNGTFQMVNLRGDLSVGGGTLLSRMDAGAIAPWHWHTSTEELVVLKGTIIRQFQGEEPETVSSGGYTQLPAKRVHRFRCTDDSECIIFVVDEGKFDVHWVDDEGNSISEEAAMVSGVDSGNW
jgi:quercetin dioxygenase-like cupin family protein